MIDFKYRLSRHFERISVLLGVGKFEVPTSIFCSSCISTPDDLCDECREIYLFELPLVNFSDAFDKRINMRVGVSGVMVGVSAWLWNAGAGFWQEGPLTAVSTEFIKSQIPEFFSKPFFVSLANAVLTIVFFGSLAAFLLCLTLAGYLSIIWFKTQLRRSTWKTYAVAILSGIIYLAIVSLQLLSFAELLVAWPVYLGCSAFLDMALKKNKYNPHGGRMTASEMEKEARKA